MRLKQASKKQNTSVSKMTEAILDKTLAKYEAADLEQIYRAFESLKGIGGTDITDASTTINEVLYGAKGA